ncbi:hypothetical protein B0I35DRAFT_435573 [Stachybotrys elegans]|uniref:Thiaminase-2/PQQC domain-containing protein n=1 Tax=Stachybotrys elegans TaxID=80388 RepID=A0A8K0STE1_9HYPO|nr:hypothetical protein B0I35DRAFT_435573 [Stachybotrys elegans]
MASQRLTEQLLSNDPSAYISATQSPFLAAAAKGQLPKDVLGQWLANDRMYIHAYIGGLGNLLSFIQLPFKATERNNASPAKLLDWSIDALVNLRDEEQFFLATAAEYGLTIDLAATETKVEGLRRFESMFKNITGSDHILLPWLEAAIIFYATEKCYLDAWSWAKGQMAEVGEASNDADGGALRAKFIPQWSSPEFAKFVERLGNIIDEAVEREIAAHGEGVKARILRRATVTWHDVLVAEEAFWPKI